MRTLHNNSILPTIWGLLLIAVLAACGSDTSDDQTVAVNLSLIIDEQQAKHQSASSRLMAWIERWFPGATPAWAQQAVTDITRINVQISGPGIPVPATADVRVTDPTSGKVIPVRIQARVGADRTITVSAFNTANAKIFGGTLTNVNLTAGAPINLELTLVPLFTVTVQKLGNGGGTVTSSPPGIDCGLSCENQFPRGTTVSLTASAAPGSFFARWGGACSANRACNVSGSATVTAEFTAAPNTGTLTVTKIGSGSGIVTSTPSGISCGAACSAEFTTPTTMVVLQATPTGGSTFAGWSGAGCSGTGTCTVLMLGDEIVTANFIAAVSTFTLTVTKNGAGIGEVTSTPAGIDCGVTCADTFATGATVTLSAAPTTGSSFGGWSGGGCGGTAPCVIVMNQNRTVTATFNAVPATLTVNKAGTGAAAGSVTTSPSGINCGSTCSASFPTGSTVTLTATAPAGTVFAGWSGGGCSGTGMCTTVMATSQTVVATFSAVPMSP